LKFLTKTLFKKGLECPIKLSVDYESSEDKNEFLDALADGGFQAEELSRLYYSPGVLIEDYDYATSLQKTRDLIKKPKSIIYEAAFLHENLFIRTDILVKTDNVIKVIEVKAKSFDSTMENIFKSKSGNIRQQWRTYLFDLAFQKYVVKKNYPEYKIESHLMLADKSKKASIDGLNQLFQITKDPNVRTGIMRKVDTLKDTGDPIMESRNISDLINDIIEKDIHKIHGLSFLELVENFTEVYTNQKEINWKNYNDHVCRECWIEQFDISENDKLQPNIYELWQFRKQKKLFKLNVFFLDQLVKSDFDDTHDNHLSVKSRQWLQIEKRVAESLGMPVDFYLDVENLRDEMVEWKFPLHFIDFETCTSALPFTKGRHPYEQIAFQYSHHIVYSDGNIQHKSEYINAEPGKFPNYEFARSLKKDLENDKGSVFKYATHENSILNAIYDQLIDSDEKDKGELMDFIRSITNKKENNELVWRGDRDMIDMCDLVKKYFYDSYMKGSNSIKVVLPAVIKICEFVNKKYSKPISEINLTSLNFSGNHVWIIDGNLDPYISLPAPDFSKVQNPVGDINKLNNGGDALTAYAKIQYQEMSSEERNIIKQSLLKYCELDTLAMVMIYEFFASELKLHGFSN
tara:strand:- start:1252 stop:3144 length:1893 start_codon:yes stop_codon:yes gene_type:complete